MFLGYIHSFRALAILFIVAGHSIDFFSWPLDSSLERFFRIFFSNGTALFVFIAGYLFQHLTTKFNTRKYYVTKFKYVLVPYFLISIPAILIFVTGLERESVWVGFYDNPTWLQILYFYLTGLHLAPLWFIPMITMFYLIAPFLIKADQSEYFYYSIPFLLLLSCIIDRGMPHQSFFHFFSIYTLGMFCSHYKEKINKILASYGSLLLLTFLVCFLVYIEFYFMKGTMTFVNFLQKCLMSLLFLGILIGLVKETQPRLIKIVADTSFGIFFIHSYVLTSGKMIYISINGSLVTGNGIGYFIISILTTLLCLMLVLIIKHIFGSKSRYVVGS